MLGWASPDYTNIFGTVVGFVVNSRVISGKMGIYMGIFNFFITIPQIINGIVGGPMVKNVYNNQPVYAIVLAGIFMLCAAVSVVYVYDPAAIVLNENTSAKS